MKSIMSGNFVKEKIERAGIPLAEVARSMNITPQTLNERLNVHDIKVGVLSDIARALGKSIYFFFDESEDIKESTKREPVARYSARQAQKSSSSEENIQQLLRAKDDIIAAQRKTIQAYERLLQQPQH